jgi:hypothetical protein
LYFVISEKWKGEYQNLPKMGKEAEIALAGRFVKEEQAAGRRFLQPISKQHPDKYELKPDHEAINKVWSELNKTVAPRRAPEIFVLPMGSYCISNGSLSQPTHLLLIFLRHYRSLGCQKIRLI